MIGFTAEAARQLQNLRRHYEDRERYEAVHSLIAAMHEASERIEADPVSGLSAPRPYPDLARLGWAWIKARRYWVAYTPTRPPVITAVFYDAADLPSRL